MYEYIHIHIYIYIYVNLNMCIYIYMHIDQVTYINELIQKAKNISSFAESRHVTRMNEPSHTHERILHT